jgi:hypothetical protein
VQTLRAAAEQGAVNVAEFEERLSAALAAVTRADLVRLVDDLPPSPATGPAPALAPSHPDRTSSHYWLWVLLPYLAAAAWVHAALVTRSTRYWLLAALYAIPLALASIVAPGVDEEIPNWVNAIAVVFWIVNAIHAWTARPVVDATWARARAAAQSRERAHRAD